MSISESKAPGRILFLFRSLAVSSLLLLLSCQDRLFDNPFDPGAGQIALEIINTIRAPTTQPLGLTWDDSTLWLISGSTNELISLDRLCGAPIRALPPPFAQASGAAYDGQDLWICSRSQVDIVKINLLNGAIQKRLNLQRGP